MSHQLRVVSGSKAGQVIQLGPGKTVSIGRGAEATISVPDDNTLSRLHAEVVQQGGQWYLANKSQHGSFMNGEVFQDQRPLQPGAEFQVGGTKFLFEAAGAGAPGVMAPVGGGGGGGGDAGAMAGAAGAAAADALKNLPSGPVRIDGSGEGFPIGDLVKGGLGIVKANLMPSLCIFAPTIVFQILMNCVGFVAQHLPAIAVTIIGLGSLAMSLIISLATPLMVGGYMMGVKRYQETGESMGIKALFKFEHVVAKYLLPLVTVIGCYCCFVPGFLISFSLPIYLDKPHLGFGGAIKGSLAFVKRNIVPCILLYLVFGVVNFVGVLACGLGILVTMPALVAAHWLAYECKRSAFEAAMAEDGISG